MAGYRETTARALEGMSKRPRSVPDLMSLLGCRRTNAEALVLRLLRNGHVVRERRTMGEVILRRDPGGPVTRPNLVYFYSTTPKGRERLRRILGGS